MKPTLVDDNFSAPITNFRGPHVIPLCIEYLLRPSKLVHNLLKFDTTVILSPGSENVQSI